jgi:hypothetical protein
LTTFEKIKAAIEPFGLPSAPGIYNGNKDDGWFVYNYADDYGAAYADDAPTQVIVSIQLHLYLPINQNFIALKNKIRKALVNQGFSFAQISVYTDEDDAWRHIVFECDTFEDDAI